MAATTASGASATHGAAKPGFWGWLNKRLPVDEFITSQLHRLLRAEELQHLVLLRLARAGGAGAAAASPASSSPCSTRWARRPRSTRSNTSCARWTTGWLHPLPALHRRLGVLHRRLPAHVPRAAVRLVQGAARAAVAVRHARVPRADGRGLHGLRAALGQHVVLGRAGDREPVRHHPGHRPGAGGVDPRRLRHRRCHAQPLLRAARGGAAAGAAAAGGAAPGGAAPDRLEQSGRHRDQGEDRAPTASRSTAFRSIPTTR